VKRTREDLALFGGPPAFAEPLHVGRPNTGDEAALLERLKDILARRRLTNGGRYSEELEQRIADLLGVRHCVAVCNGTVGLEIAIRALGMSGEVIVPSFTFIATAHALRWQGITPVFCDIDPLTHTIDPACVERLITPRTTGILGVHLWGRGCDAAALEEIAARRGLALLLDAAHAIGCSHRGRMIGAFGDAEVLSFHATKVLNAFEGGAIVTNNATLAERLRLMRNFGFADIDLVVCVGTNGKMSEAAAAMGLTSLDSLERFVAVNRRNHELYGQLLGDIPGVSLVRYDPRERANWHYVVVEIDAAAAGMHRDRVLEALQAERVMARRYFYPGCHRMEPYASEAPDAGLCLPETERLTERVLQLPNGTAVGPAEIAEVCQMVRLVVGGGTALRQRDARLGSGLA
jgi:dTDP-4-amino-4,6-dideoxygalactose transaminase